MSARYRRLFRLRFTRPSPDDVDAEFQFHLTMRVRELEASGLSPEAARERALAEFGDIDDARHFCHREDEDRMRRRRRGMWMESALQDFRYGLRSLRAAPLAAAVALACVAIGVGANLAILTVVRGVILRPLPYANQQALVSIGETFQGDGPYNVDPATYRDIAALDATFADVTAWQRTGGDLVTAELPRRISGARATANLFTVLGVPAAIGRVFDAGDTLAGNPRVVVLSDRLWRSEFGADPAVIGRSVSIGGTPYRVAGVMPAGFGFPVEVAQTDYWIPMPWSAMGNLTNRMNHVIQVTGRLRDGVDIETARRRMGALAGRLANLYPNEQEERGFAVVSIEETTIGAARKALGLVMGAVGLVFLIACANVASVLLARGTARRREVSIRTALGATRVRLLQQLLAEYAALALAGALVGVITARIALVLLLKLVERSLPRADQIAFDLPTILAGVLFSSTVVMIVGLFPAVQSTRGDLRQGLIGSATTGTGGRRLRPLQYLIGAEAALALILLVGAGLLVRSFAAIADIDPGFATENRLTFRISSPGSAVVPDSERYDRFLAPILGDIQRQPGVRSAGAVSLLPVQDGITDILFLIEGAPAESDKSRLPDAQRRWVAGDYFRTMGIRLVAGRLFSSSDIRGNERVVIVNEELVRRFFNGRSPVGRRIDPGSGFATIVGVVASTRQMIETPPMPEFYVPAAQDPRQVGAMTFVVATEHDPYAVLPNIRSIVRRVAPAQALYRVGLLQDVVPESLRARKLVLTLLAVFAALAMTLSAAGVYGVTAYAVTRRTREIGIRMALGADRRRVTRMIVLEVMNVIAAGVAVGLLVAISFSGVMTAYLYQVRPIDTRSLVAASALVLGAAVIAAMLPALRAARLAPVAAMRTE